MNTARRASILTAASPAASVWSAARSARSWDKSQIYQVIRSILEGNEVVAIVAPSFVGQFGKDVTVPKFLTAMKQLGSCRRG